MLCGGSFVFTPNPNPTAVQGRWAPRRAPGEPRVGRSPLQLPPGTTLIVDETLLLEGKLDASGTASLAALQRVLMQQVGADARGNASGPARGADAAGGR